MHQHLLRVVGPVVKFESLIAALRQAGERFGWLEYSADLESDTGLESDKDLESDAPTASTESLNVAAGLGALRAVAIGGGQAVAVKPMRGAPVLHDVLREYYRGCQLVLVVGDVEAPELEPDADHWMITVSGQPARRWTTEKLVAALRKPAPWG